MEYCEIFGNKAQVHQSPQGASNSRVGLMCISII
jgi:hypothetical protein